MIQQIVETIADKQSFLIAAHAGPDGDAAGSTLALAEILREMGKDVVAYNVDGVPEAFQFLVGAEKVVSQLPSQICFDVAFVLDSGELKRAGLPENACWKTLVNIDHHPHSSFGDICYLDTEACATGVMIHRLLCACQHPLSQQVAEALYTAILSDTGSFRYSNSNPEAFAVAGELVSRGVDTWKIASRIYESQTPLPMTLLALVLRTLDISVCGRYASVSMSTEMLEQAGATAEDTDGFINYPRAVNGVEVAVFCRQISATQTKVGFRSRGRVNVSEISRELGGGGHHNAAGVTLDGELAQVRERVTTILADYFAQQD